MGIHKKQGYSQVFACIRFPRERIEGGSQVFLAGTFKFTYLAVLGVLYLVTPGKVGPSREAGGHMSRSGGELFYSSEIVS